MFVEWLVEGVKASETDIMENLPDMHRIDDST